MVVMYVVHNLAAVCVESEDGGCSTVTKKESDICDRLELGAMSTENACQELFESVERDGKSVVFVVDLERDGLGIGEDGSPDGARI